MTRLFLASIAVVSALAVHPYPVKAQKPTPKKGVLPKLLFPRLPQLSYCPPCKYLIPTRGRAEATGVAMSRPSSHDDGYHTPPCVRGTGHVILAPYPLAV